MAIGVSIIKEFADQVRKKLILQLINGISKILQIFLKYFNGTILPAIFDLKLNKALLLLLAEKPAILPLPSKYASSL